MNLNKIISLLDLDKIDLNEVESLAGRRGFFQKAGGLGMKAALAAFPVAVLSLMPRVLKAQSSTLADVLNFALTLEYLEDEFYIRGLNASGLIPAADRNIFTQISKHETAHVTLLKAALGAAAVSKPTFDFTAGGQFGDAFTNYMTFLALSQSFEDTGVRAYKGQAGNLLADKDVLQVALQIHSVEARHASVVRSLRGKVSGQAIKGWITGKESNGAPQVIYDGEENITQAGVNLDGITTLSNLSAAAKTESYDEPLTKEQVLAIVGPFLA